MDPQSPRYQTLKRTLLQIQDDLSALVSILSVEADNGRAWTAASYRDLRDRLTAGQLREAEEVGKLIGAVLAAKESGAQGEETEDRVHRSVLDTLLGAITALLADDIDKAIFGLAKVSEAKEASASLRWVAWLWLSRALAQREDREDALVAAESAWKLAQTLDADAMATSLCHLGELKRLTGALDEALQHLVMATERYRELENHRGLAMAWMGQARIHAAQGDSTASDAAAMQAVAIDAAWEQPTLFLAEEAMIKGDWAEAKRRLGSLADSEGDHPDVARVAGLVRRVQEGTLPPETVSAYVKLRRRPSDASLLRDVQALAAEAGSFGELKALVGWTLIRLRRWDDAEQVFNALSEEAIDSHSRQSVVLGLGCIANRKSRHRQPGGWVRAAQASAQHERRDLSQARIKIPSEEFAPVTAVGLKSVTAPPSRPAEVASAAFTGPLQLFAVPDLLDFLKSSRRTGTLVVTSAAGMGAVHMVDGLITGAAAPGAKTVGKILRDRAAITEAQLAQATGAQEGDQPARLLGTILLRQGAVSRDAVEQALTEQIRCAVRELVSWTTGQFAFEPDRPTDQAETLDVSVALDTQSVVLDALRELDEARREESDA